MLVTAGLPVTRGGNTLFACQTWPMISADVRLRLNPWAPVAQNAFHRVKGGIYEPAAPDGVHRAPVKSEAPTGRAHPRQGANRSRVARARVNRAEEPGRCSDARKTE